MAGFPEIKAAIDKQADAFELFVKRQHERFDELGNRVESLETRASTPSAGARKAASAPVCQSDVRHLPC